MFDAHQWGINPDFNINVTKDREFVDQQENRYTLMNQIRNKCSPCDDYWQCIHFQKNGRLVLLQQTLNAIQTVMQLI